VENYFEYKFGIFFSLTGLCILILIWKYFSTKMKFKKVIKYCHHPKRFSLNLKGHFLCFSIHNNNSEDSTPTNLYSYLDNPTFSIAKIRLTNIIAYNCACVYQNSIPGWRDGVFIYNRHPT